MSSPASTHPELPIEQAYLDRAYAHLARMRARTKAATEIADNAAQEVDSAIAGHLNAVEEPRHEIDGLAFGRLDADAGDTWYVGRRPRRGRARAIRGHRLAGTVRTPLSSHAADPLELRRRRRFLMTARHVDDLFDEVFDDPDSVDAAHHGGIPDPLLAELERSRTGEMRDIVATIAAEQDVVIRAPLDTCLVVQEGRAPARRPSGSTGPPSCCSSTGSS